VETQLRKTNELTTASPSGGGLVGRSARLRQGYGGQASDQASLMDASVVSVKDQWSFVVANIGEKHGVEIGMPLRVMRGGKKIGTLRGVDVRQRIGGAEIEDGGKEKVE